MFTRGRSPFGYLRAARRRTCSCRPTPRTCARALDAGFPAALVYTQSPPTDSHPDEVRIAFDGDAVLFADEAERVYQAAGPRRRSRAHEADHATRPLPPGPFKPLLEALHRLQVAATRPVPMRLRTALVTARSAPAHERAIRTLMDWNIEVDEAMFLGGLREGPVPARVRARLLLRRPDAPRRVARRAHVPSGHVPHGVANE